MSVDQSRADVTAIREATWARASDEERAAYIGGAFHALSDVFGVVTEVLATRGDLIDVSERLQALLSTYNDAFTAKVMLP